MTRGRHGHDEDGITLVELLITVVLMSMIIGAIAASFVTAFNTTRPNSERVRQSNDAQLIAGFLVRDAQSAGGTNPNTGTAYDTTAPDSIGVSTSDAAGCSPDPSLVLRFSWIDHVPDALPDAPPVTRVANYYLDAANEIVRKTCVGGAAESTLVLGREIANATATCNGPVSPCTSTMFLPDTVTMHLTSTPPESTPPATATAFTYDLTASLRPEGQDKPTDVNAAPIGLLALGHGCTQGTTGFAVSGGSPDANPNVTIYGQVVIDTKDGIVGCRAMRLRDSYTYNSGAISIFKGGTCSGCPSTTSYSKRFGDPYATAFASLKAGCATAANPAGSSFAAGSTPLVFNSTFSAGDASFGAGTYVFCNGLAVGHITTQPGAKFYIVKGAYAQSGGSAAAGLVYAPTSVVAISGDTSFTAKTVVAGAVTVAGTVAGSPTVVIGSPPGFNLAITGPDQLPAWTVDHPYPPTTMTATKVAGSASWSATGLPAGLAISATTGVISGTPTASGSSSVQITVVDSLGYTTSRPYLLQINALPKIIKPADLTDWTINRDYPNTQISVSPGTDPYTWSATGLPPGLSITVGGVVFGTPTTTGTFTPTIRVTDASGASDTQDYSLKINATPSITGPSSLNDWTADQPGYPDQIMTWKDGTAPITWAASGLPPGLSIAAGTGVISGTPNAAGTFAVSVTLTDKAGASDTRNYSVKINAPPSIATASLAIAEVGRPYNFTVTPSGGTPPLTWALGAHPAWLSIGASTGTLTGTPPPAATGTSTVNVRITDSTGATSQRNFNLTVAAAVQINGPFSLPNWTVNRDYPGTAITGTGGVTPFAWSATGLPPGMSINPNTGVITGTPGASGTSTVVVTVVDALGGTDTQSFSVTINPSPVITTSALPNGEQGIAYSTTLAATSGTVPYTWAGSGLPPGLTLDPSGVLSGTPTVAGTFSVTITVTDAAGASDSRILDLNLSTGPGVGGDPLPDWTVDVVYPNPTITGSSGAPPYTFTATGLPTGLSIGKNSGVVSGIPTATGTYAVVITVQDSLGGTSTQNYSVTINAVPNITTGSLPSGTIAVAYPDTTIAATGGTAPFDWMATGLPPGLSIDASSGVISGTPTIAGTFSVDITLTDAAGATATSGTLTLTIN